MELYNNALKNLATTDELKEVFVVKSYGFQASVESRARLAEIRGHKIIFAFMQDIGDGVKIPYWHVCDPTSKNYRSTLSMEGLKDWKINIRAGVRRA